MRNNFFTIIIIFILISFTYALAANYSEPLIRYPSINNNGTQVAFSFQGDIWKANVNGSNPVRLTIHEAYDAIPMWNYTGDKIAFISNRWGGNDIFVINADGGIPKRLTYNSAGDILSDFTKSDQIIFSTGRIYRQVEWDHEINSVSANGGTPVRILDAVGDYAVESPNGKFIAYVKGACRVAREAYRGSANKEIWLYNKSNNSFTKLTAFQGNDFKPQWAGNNAIYFISSRSGKYNIHKLTIDAEGNKVGEIEQITKFKNKSVRYIDISSDGNTIVMETIGKVFILNIPQNILKEFKVNISTDYRFDPVVHKKFGNNVTEFEVSPNGKYSLFTIRGEIFIKENDKEKKRTVNLTNHPYKDEHPQWLNDSTVIFVSDRNGQNDLYLIKSGDKKESNLFKTLKRKTTKITNTQENENWPIISPDRKKIIYEINTGKLVVADISKNGKITNKKYLLNGWAAPQGVVWSPDSKWIAYALNNLEFNSDIYIQKIVTDSKPINVSMHPLNDYGPVWSPDGSKLAFVSERNNHNADIWFAWLTKKDWEKTKHDWSETKEDSKSETKEKSKKKKDKKKTKPIKIDTDKIYERLVQVTSKPGDENNIAISKDGKTFYFTAETPTSKGRNLFSIKWDGTKIKEITKSGSSPSSLVFDKKHKYLYMITKGGNLKRYKAGSKKVDALPFSAKMDIDFNAEQSEIFEDAWSALKISFYDPNFHGRNWDSLKAIYKPIVLRASTKNDFRYMFNNMLGELNASHMGLYGKGRESTQNETTGLLGVEVEPLEQGVKIIHVVLNSPADKEISKLNIGDIILSVNGKKITKSVNFYSLLVNLPEEKILLTVKNNKGDVRDVIIRPTKSLKDNLYEEWVEQRRKLVDKYSKGRLGYLHIKAMGWKSFEKFERDLTAAGYGKDGLVIDVRYNGGGWTTDYLMTVLNYKQHAYTIPRGAAKNLQKEHKKFRKYYPLGERLPYSAWTKPSVALCNENSYSNAEIFSHAYKNLKIGKLVGMPTFGAVISTGAHQLIDGSMVRLPFRGWYILATDENMDFVPAIPDFVLDNKPNSKSNNEDEQLKKAIDVLLQNLN